MISSRVISFIAFIAFSIDGFAVAPRTVMLQLFEWPWESVAQECEQYLGPNGFAAVQVSPPQEHLVLGANMWWERYQPVSYNLISRSGNEEQFKNMVQRCAKSGVDIYVDVVLNHMAGISQGQGFGGTTYQKYQHSGLYSYDDFHHCGLNGNDQIVNFNDRYEIQSCELFGLADLKTGSMRVQEAQANYLNKLVSFGVKGFRIDAAKHVLGTDLSSLFSKVTGSPYLISEAWIGPFEPVSIEEYTSFSDVNNFQYSFDIGINFLKGSFTRLIKAMNQYINSQSAVVFIENHDLQRLESENILNIDRNPQSYFLAHVFMLTWPYGYPQLFSGYRFTDYNQGPPVDSAGATLPALAANGTCISPWSCEHRIPGIAPLVQFRNFTNSFFAASDIWTGTNQQFAFSRGNLGFVLINNSDHSLRRDFKTSLPDGNYCDIIDPSYNMRKKSCPKGHAVKAGVVSITCPAGTAIVLQTSTTVK